MEKKNVFVFYIKTKFYKKLIFQLFKVADVLII